MIGIVIATETEFKNIWRTAFEKVIDITHKSPYKTYLVKVNNIKIRSADSGAVVVISGVGKVNAACATQYLVDKYFTDRIINAGVCGATAKAFEDSNTVSVDVIVNQDYNTSPVDGENTPQPKVVNNSLYHDTEHAKPLFTQDHFETSYTGIEGYFDMEGYAVAEVCSKNGVEFEILKSVTDVINSDSQGEQYITNMDIACKRVAEKLIKVMGIEQNGKII